MKYDPYTHIDSDEWRTLDETERGLLVEDYHEKAGIELPNAQLHASIHVVVENQIAMGSELPTKETLDRLMADGPDRHDAIHAIGSVLSKHIFNILKGVSKSGFDERTYRGDLGRLTAEDWRSGDAAE